MNIDTNSINQTINDVVMVKTQLSPYIPALVVVAAWLGREIRNFNQWLTDVLTYIESRGGLGMIIVKLLWNPSALKVPETQLPTASSQLPKT